jgi:hypothetical protein
MMETFFCFATIAHQFLIRFFGCLFSTCLGQLDRWKGSMNIEGFEEHESLAHWIALAVMIIYLSQVDWKCTDMRMLMLWFFVAEYLCKMVLFVEFGCKADNFEEVVGKEADTQQFVE